MLRDGNVEDIYPLSYLQHGMLFHNLSEQASGVGIEQVVCTLHEEIDQNLLVWVWQRVVRKWKDQVLGRSRFESYASPGVIPRD